MTKFETLPADRHIFIARHGETVFNAAGRIQGNLAHTPLTRRGFAQAEAMGEGLKTYLSERGIDPNAIDLASSTTGRALQTLAVICEHIGQDWHKAEHHEPLGEISMGAWEGLYYRDIIESDGPIWHEETKLFSVVPPEGESIIDVANRLRRWVADQSFERDTLIISHGMTSRVLRGILAGEPDHDHHHVPLAPSLPQGSMVAITGGREEVIVNGDGAEQAS